MPPGVANLVTGYGPEVGQPRVTHPDVDMVSFTGSQAVGKQIAASAGAQLKRVSLEMGGKNALVVLDDVDVEEAVTGALWGGFSTAGNDARPAAGSWSTVRWQTPWSRRWWRASAH